MAISSIQGRVARDGSMFRIGSHVVTFKSAVAAGITDGDLVTAAGDNRTAGFRAYAVRNDTKNAVYNSSGPLIMICSVVLIVISFPLMLILIGVPLAFVGLYGCFIGFRGLSANQVLAAAPIMAG